MKNILKMRSNYCYYSKKIILNWEASPSHFILATIQVRQIIVVHTCFSSRTENRHGIFPIRHRRGMTWCSDILGTKSILWLCNKFSQTKHMNTNPKCGIWGRTQRIRGQNGACYEHKYDKPWSMQPKEIKDMSFSLNLNRIKNSHFPLNPMEYSDSIGVLSLNSAGGIWLQPAMVLKAAFNNILDVGWWFKLSGSK